MAAHRTTIYLLEKDRRDLKLIQASYGLATLSDAIRLAIRLASGTTSGHSQSLAPVKARKQRADKDVDRTAELVDKARRISAEAQQMMATVESYLRQARDSQKRHK